MPTFRVGLLIFSQTQMWILEVARDRHDFSELSFSVIDNLHFRIEDPTWQAMCIKKL